VVIWVALGHRACISALAMLSKYFFVDCKHCVPDGPSESGFRAINAGPDSSDVLHIDTPPRFWISPVQSDPTCVSWFEIRINAWKKWTREATLHGSWLEVPLHL
jgi:hypothetical protein